MGLRRPHPWDPHPAAVTSTSPLLAQGLVPCSVLSTFFALLLRRVRIVGRDIGLGSCKATAGQWSLVLDLVVGCLPTTASLASSFFLCSSATGADSSATAVLNV
jgi:hypothetical protein